MALLILPPQEYLRQRLDYDPQTGVLTWRPRPRTDFIARRHWLMWNTRFAGTAAGFPHAAQGRFYILVGVDSVYYKAHRLIWRWVTGEAPPDIDHEDTDGTNNRWNNLRITDRSQSCANRRRRKTQRFAKGVTQAKSGRFEASISFRKKRTHLGTFDNPTEAHAAYCEAARRLHGEFARFE